MAKLGVLIGPLVLLLWVFCVVDVVTTRDGGARRLPRWGWLVLVLLFPLVGSVAWLLAGRPSKRAPRDRPHQRQTPSFPEYDRPGRAAAQDAEADEEFLRRCRERAEEQRRRYREQQKRLRDADGGAP
jgi:hypothetical protein